MTWREGRLLMRGQCLATRVFGQLGFRASRKPLKFSLRISLAILTVYRVVNGIEYLLCLLPISHI